MPYTDYYQVGLPSRGLRDMALFTCRLWCIHFWQLFTTDDVMNGNYESLQAIMINGFHIGDDAGSSGAGPSAPGPSIEEQRRQRFEPRRFSHSRFVGSSRKALDN